MIIALAMDQSPRATGWAIGSPGETTPKFGMFSLKPWNDDEGPRLAEFRDWMTALIKTHTVSHVFYESPVNVQFSKSFDVTSKQNQQIGLINLVAYDCRVPIHQVSVDSWRSRFLGTTKAPPGLKGDMARSALKDMALRACALRGWMIDDDNVAEALGILDFGLSTLSRAHAGGRDIIFRRQELRAWQGAA